MAITAMTGEGQKLVLGSTDTPSGTDYEAGATAIRPSDGKIWMYDGTTWQEL